MDNQKRFKLGELEIEPNYPEGWIKEKVEGEVIFIHKKMKDECLPCSLIEAKFIVNAFNKIIEYYKNIPEFKIGYHVNIINGKFKGCRGKIVDIDECDNKRPLAVKIDEIDFEGVCYIGYDDVKL